MANYKGNGYWSVYHYAIDNRADNYIPIYLEHIDHSGGLKNDDTLQWSVGSYPSDSNVCWIIGGQHTWELENQPTCYKQNYTDDFVSIKCSYSKNQLDISYEFNFLDSSKNVLSSSFGGINFPPRNPTLRVSHAAQFGIFGFIDDDNSVYFMGNQGAYAADLDEGVTSFAIAQQNVSKGNVGDGKLTYRYMWDSPLKVNVEASRQLAKMVSLSTLFDSNDPNPGDGDSHGGGGGGTDDLGGDPIKDTGVPTIEATDSGLMTLYNPTVSELQALGRFLWSDGLDLNSFKKLFNDPFDTLLGLSIIPIVPPTSGTKKIMFGNLDSGVSAKVISHQFVPNVDMGSVTLGEVYNGALDYSPFTTVSIYLPFIGYRELNVQDIMNSKIHLVYKFDVLTGGCIAELYVDHLKTGNKSKDNSKFRWESHSGLLASFEGQCAVNIPLASQDYTNTIRAMIGAVGMVGGAAASFATGNPALGVAALAVGSANSSIQASTPTVQRSGHLSSSNAIMANLTPFLTVTRPHQCKPSKYYKLRGVPSQIYVSKLSSLTTSRHDYYLQVAEIPDIKVAGATDTEIAEIKNLLKEGVVL